MGLITGKIHVTFLGNHCSIHQWQWVFLSMRFFALSTLFCTITFMTYGQTLNVMTYNIRFDTPADGVNAWPNRIQKVASVIQQHDPDIIGVQEALPHQLKELVKVLPQYAYTGVGRDDGKEKGEFSAILYRRNRFGLLNSNTFWLSESPDSVGSKSWDAAITRIATWARFYDRITKQEFFILNTHFDHIGVMAREQSVILIKNKLPKLSQEKPAIVMGDFNCQPEEAAYKKMLTVDDLPLADALMGPRKGTYCGFEVSDKPCIPIDYIFHSATWVPRNFEVITTNDGKYYPSDHLPVFVSFELTLEK